VFILEIDAPVRGSAAASLIGDGHLGKVRADRFESQLTVDASPGLDDVNDHVGIFFVTRVQGFALPSDRDLVASADSGYIVREFIILIRRRDGVLVGINDFQAHDITVQIQEFSLDPTGFVIAARLGKHPGARIGAPEHILCDAF